jgi:hypothetical protein
VTGTWTVTGSMSHLREGHTATLLPSGKVLVAGGAGSSATLSSAELYDPLTGTWTATGSMVASRQFHTATLLPSGFVYCRPRVLFNALSRATREDSRHNCHGPLGFDLYARNAKSVSILLGKRSGIMGSLCVLGPGNCVRFDVFFQERSVGKERSGSQKAAFWP